MTTKLTRHFIIESTAPATKETRWRANRSTSVICPTAERAIELFREHYPDDEIHVIRNVGQRFGEFILDV